MCVYVGVHAHACACAGKVWGRECWSPSLFSTIFLKDRRDCLSLKPKLMDLASWLASRVQQSAYLCPHPLPLLRVHPPKWISLRVLRHQKTLPCTGKGGTPNTSGSPQSGQMAGVIAPSWSSGCSGEGCLHTAQQDGTQVPQQRSPWQITAPKLLARV